ncbi:hypothetical protein C8Q80DRAFT_1125251 [Daedaleopsis nitida]|nr:hypothetical protein C8Q80DRAFT_1125251 [Daedaleopsis nitida]
MVFDEIHYLEYHGPTSVWRLGAAQRISPNTSEGKASASPEPAPAIPTNYLDWSRHLPSDVPLTRAEHDRILDILFKFNLSWGLRIIPELFLRDMHRVLTLPRSAPAANTAHYSPMLHNACLALATAYSDEPALRGAACRRRFAEKAKTHIEADCERPTIALITALTTLALYHSTCGEQTLAYLYFGMAGRMTQSLGLKTDCSSWVKSGLITQADMLDRNWAYWTVYAQDILWSLYVGRECCIVPARKERPFSVPYVGSSELDTAMWYWAPSKMPPQPSYVVKTFEQTCELMVVARRIFDFLNGLGPGTKREGALQQVSELDIQLNNWKDALTPEVDLTAASRPNALPHRLMLHLVYWWTLLLLHRPFYRRTKSASAGSGVEIDHVKLCNRASDNIMLLLGIWHEKYTIRYLPITLLQVVYCAGTSYILSAVQATSGPRLGRVALTTALAQAEHCLRYLLIAAKSFECANEVANILSNLLHEQLRPRLLTRTLEPNDILPHVPDLDMERSSHEQQQHRGAMGMGDAEAAADALSLSATITNLDALLDQCRFQTLASSFSPSAIAPSTSMPTAHHPDWARQLYPILPVSQQSSASSTQSPSHAQFPASTHTSASSTSNSGGFPSLSQTQVQSLLGRMQPEDIDMDYAFSGMDVSMGMGMGMGMPASLMAGQPLSNRPFMSSSFLPVSGPEVTGPVFPALNSNTSFDRAAPMPQPPQAQGRGGEVAGGAGPMNLGFSPEELAVMDQILGHNYPSAHSPTIDFGLHAGAPQGGQTRFDVLR